MKPLTRLRDRRRLTLKELGTAIGCTPAFVYKVEQGLRPMPPGTVVRWAEALAVAPGEVEQAAGVLDDDLVGYLLRTPGAREVVRQMMEERPSFDGSRCPVCCGPLRAEDF